MRCRRCLPLSDHPPGQGGNHGVESFGRSPSGPSPRAGGKPGQARARGQPPRTIPSGRGETQCPPTLQGGAADHPPGQGGNLARVTGFSLTGGPSPRAGGKPPRRQVPGLAFRTIPPGRGETLYDEVVIAGATDHPPGQGGNSFKLPKLWSEVGPSPRAGGKPLAQQVSDAGRRTIPPGRGETKRLRPISNSTSDHPPGQGGNLADFPDHLVPYGPSPRAGGKRLAEINDHIAQRTIPPGRGETAQNHHQSCRNTDHPPGQGGNHGVESPGRSPSGPSPRAGGKLGQRDSRFPAMRTIPPGRGETFLDLWICAPLTDHPPGQGGNFRRSTSGSSNVGPSPRAGGKLSASHSQSPPLRTIPPGRGETRDPLVSLLSFSDHPPGQGGNRGSGKRHPGDVGPSPRAGGKRRVKSQFVGVRRTIPPGRGETHVGRRDDSAGSDHPPGQGGNGLIAHLCNGNTGPSPRAGGKPVRWRV